MAAGVLALSLSACGTPGGGAAQSGESGEGNRVDVGQEVLGSWSSDEKGTPRLEFSEDGTVQGTDGCNGISTSYEVQDDRVVLKEFASTLKACLGVDDWLRGVHEVRPEGDTLLVSNAAGEEIGELHRDA
ncbi:hypothetical protein B4915_08865 [Leucobacter massiliensis]|uniref:DUF306 domain-containing protein n=1 Tax=Leucobacter massiliensis TaxID=1686285 RepID=A0A2S9QN17_9MICO|nr:hypothetical protein B4915_08865 [Leucobacter massiliensis]